MNLFHEERGIRLYHGDALDALDELVTPRSVVITDPPYGAGSYPTDKRPPDELVRQLISVPKTAALFGWPEDLVALCMRLGVVPDEWVTWWCANKCHPRAATLREAECIAVFGEVPGVRRIRRKRSDTDRTIREHETKLGKAFGGRTNKPPIETAQDGDVWRIMAPGAGFNAPQKRHPNEKPLELMTRLVLLCSNEGDTVVDPYCGSGTTLEAARALGRSAVGVELVEEHCRTAVERLAQQVLGGVA